MTIKVNIKHDSLGYDKDLIVSEKNIDVTGQLTDRGHEAYYHRLKPGQSITLYVHSTQALTVVEAPNES